MGGGSDIGGGRQSGCCGCSFRNFGGGMTSSSSMKDRGREKRAKTLGSLSTLLSFGAGGHHSAPPVCLAKAWRCKFSGARLSLTTMCFSGWPWENERLDVARRMGPALRGAGDVASRLSSSRRTERLALLCIVFYQCATSYSRQCARINEMVRRGECSGN